MDFEYKNLRAEYLARAETSPITIVIGGIHEPTKYLTRYVSGGGAGYTMQAFNRQLAEAGFPVISLSPSVTIDFKDKNYWQYKETDYLKFEDVSQDAHWAHFLRTRDPGIDPNKYISGELPILFSLPDIPEGTKERNAYFAQEFMGEHGSKEYLELNKSVLRTALQTSKGFVIVEPQYYTSIAGMLKAIDELDPVEQLRCIIGSPNHSLYPKVYDEVAAFTGANPNYVSPTRRAIEDNNLRQIIDHDGFVQTWTRAEQQLIMKNYGYEPYYKNQIVRIGLAPDPAEIDMEEVDEWKAKNIRFWHFFHTGRAVGEDASYAMMRHVVDEDDFPDEKSLVFYQQGRLVPGKQPLKSLQAFHKGLQNLLNNGVEKPDIYMLFAGTYHTQTDTTFVQIKDYLMNFPELRKRVVFMEDSTPLQAVTSGDIALSFTGAETFALALASGAEVGNLVITNRLHADEKFDVMRDNLGPMGAYLDPQDPNLTEKVGRAISDIVVPFHEQHNLRELATIHRHEVHPRHDWQSNMNQMYKAISSAVAGRQILIMDYLKTADPDLESSIQLRELLEFTKNTTFFLEDKMLSYKRPGSMFYVPQLRELTTELNSFFNTD